jgi:putative ABC transport system ATP-binding protein
MLIDVKNLIKIYKMGDNELKVLKGVSLSIDKGEFVAITGFSGSGKSTLMHLLGCLDVASSGDYFLDGINVSTANDDELADIRNQEIGFVFQKFHLLPDLTTLDNVALPQLYAGVKESLAREKAAKLLDLVGLSHRMDHYPYQISGGQQQRVAVARSLINNPSIILADEPTGNLDTATGNTILQVFRELNVNQGVTIIIVTHEPSIAAKTRRIIELVDGNIISDRAGSL